MSNRFTAGFAAFNFLFWLPLTLIGGTVVMEHFVEEMRGMSNAAQIGVLYVWMLLTMAPCFIRAFFGKSEA